MIVGLPYLNLVLAFLFQHKPLVFVTFFGGYALMLMAIGSFFCHEDWKTVLLYEALTVEIMQLCCGMLIPSLLLAALCYRRVYKFFLHTEGMEKQYVLMILTQILMLFLMGEYINSTIYGNAANIIDESGIIIHTNYYRMFVIHRLFIAYSLSFHNNQKAFHSKTVKYDF